MDVLRMVCTCAKKIVTMLPRKDSSVDLEDFGRRLNFACNIGNKKSVQISLKTLYHVPVIVSLSSSPTR